MSFRCACLLDCREGALLLVRIRDNRLWYLPGGTIEPGEEPEETLVREIAEELGVILLPHTITPRATVTGPALGRQGDVELVCFEAKWEGEMRPLAEVSEVAYIDLDCTVLMAPAVRLLVEAAGLKSVRAAA